VALLAGAALAALATAHTPKGMAWTGRSLSLLDPTYAAKHMPMVASVAEHQPPAWPSFFLDLHATLPLAPLGLLHLFQRRTDGAIFLIIYGTVSWYFAAVMVRLMLVLAPAACVLAGLGLSNVLTTFAAHARLAWAPPARGAGNEGGGEGEGEAAASGGSAPAPIAAGGASGGPSTAARTPPSPPPAPFTPLPLAIPALVTGGVLALLLLYVRHAAYISRLAYSATSLTVAAVQPDGSRAAYDDLREAFAWLRANTAEDARVLAWWDYGYQAAAMANRTTLVDNNTWNTTHIATVGRALASSEARAFPILQSLEADYVVAKFGGVAGTGGDDIGKFLWMVRIGGGVFPSIKVRGRGGRGRGGMRTAVERAAVTHPHRPPFPFPFPLTRRRPATSAAAAGSAWTRRARPPCWTA
jgi:dolichyl-diphosphooligosaccharide--protein glycosyltransferase